MSNEGQVRMPEALRIDKGKLFGKVGLYFLNTSSWQSIIFLVAILYISAICIWNCMNSIVLRILLLSKSPGE